MSGSESMGAVTADAQRLAARIRASKGSSWEAVCAFVETYGWLPLDYPSFGAWASAEMGTPRSTANQQLAKAKRLIDMRRSTGLSISELAPLLPMRHMSRKLPPDPLTEALAAARTQLGKTELLVNPTQIALAAEVRQLLEGLL